MSKPKSVTIKLTPKQRDQLQKLTGNEHTEVMFESVTTRGKKIAAKASLARKTPLRGIGGELQWTPGGAGGGGGTAQD